VIKRLVERGHERTPLSSSFSMGGGQAIMIDQANGTLMGGSDPRKDGMALGY
jgi:gamma-glutamyltranspeptidase/glutathione hydrolase